MFGAHHAEGLTGLLHEHPIPGFRALNELFIKPMEHVQEHLGIPTMAERAVHAESAASHGGWLDHDSLIPNVFLVGGVHAAMEMLLDRTHEHLGSAARHVKGTIKRKTSSDRTKRQKAGSDTVATESSAKAEVKKERGCRSEASDDKAAIE